MAAERTRRFLDEHGVDYEMTTHPRVVTAQQVAASEHISGWEVAKPVLLLADDELVMCVLPAPMQVDLDRASTALGAPCRLATEDEFGDVFHDCELGAEPPFGSLYGIETYLDPTIEEDTEIVFRAGTHDTTMRMRVADYLAVEDPMVVDVASKVLV
jgi:Ala-tRNA(Pro) deacylase